MDIVNKLTQGHSCNFYLTRACSCRLYSDGFALYIKTDSLVVIVSNAVDCYLIKYHNDANLQRLIVFDSVRLREQEKLQLKVQLSRSDLYV